MRKKSVYQVPGVVVLIGLFFQVSALLAQPSPHLAKIAVISWQSDSLQKQIKTSLQEELKKASWAKVVEYGENPDFVFSFNSQKVRSAASDQIALAVAVSQSLPEPILDFCAKEQVPYKALFNSNKKKKLSKDGKFVREYVSREMLKDFRHVLNLRVYTFPRSHLGETSKAVVSDGLKAVSTVYKIKK